MKIVYGKRQYPSKYSHFELYGGSQWWVFNRYFVKYLLEFCNKNPDFIKFYKHTFVPDEMFFQTIIMNSPFKDTIMNGLIYHDWTIGQPPYPSLISEIHLPILKQDLIDISYGLSKLLFARKFNAKNKAILSEIERIRSTELT
jgi:hypothetical protein